MAEIHRPRQSSFSSSRQSERFSRPEPQEVTEKKGLTVSQGTLDRIQVNILRLALPGAFIAAALLKLAQQAGGQ